MSDFPQHVLAQIEADGFKPSEVLSGSVSFVGDQEGWGEPDPRFFMQEAPKAPQWPLTPVFSPRLAKWIAEAADAKGAPVDYVALSLLTVCGSLVGNSTWVSPWAGWHEPPVLWGVCIGLPSAGKSPAIDAVLTPLRAAERPLREQGEAALAEWREASDVAEIAKAHWKEQVKVAVKTGKTPPAKPASAEIGPAPHVPRLFVNDATLERLAVIAGAQPKGVMQVRDELAGWLEGMSRYSAASDRPFWLEAYGGRSYTVERQSREPLSIDRLSIGVLGGVQPDRLNSLLMKSDDDGLLARFIPSWPDPVPVKRPDRAPDDRLIAQIIDRLMSLALVHDEQGRLKPSFIRFTDAAKGEMDSWRTEVRQIEADTEGLLVSFTGKLPGMAARISLVLAMLDWADGTVNAPAEVVTADHFDRARMVCRYALDMARRAYALASVPKHETAAHALMRALKEHRLSEFSSREVIRLGRAKIRVAAEIAPAIAALVEADVIRALDSPMGAKGGRPAKRFQVHPAIVERWS